MPQQIFIALFVMILNENHSLFTFDFDFISLSMFNKFSSIKVF